MKKKGLLIAAVAAALIAIPAVAAGAPSPGGAGTAETPAQNAAGTSTVVTAGSSVPSIVTEVTGEKTMIVGETVDKTGASISLVVDTQNTIGQQINATTTGHADVEGVSISMVTGEAEVAGLPQDVVSSIAALNSGAKPSTVLGDTSLDNFSPAGDSRAVISKDAAGNDAPAEIVMKVDYLIGASQAAAVYYDNNTGRWLRVQVLQFEAATGTVTFQTPGSCTVKFYKQ